MQKTEFSDKLNTYIDWQLTTECIKRLDTEYLV
jgi:hypothetical protein